MSAPPLRLLTHPGPMAPERRESRADAAARAFRFSLMPGRSLHEGLVGAMGRIGAASAAFVLTGGGFARLKYCIAAPNPEGPQVARYSAPIPAGPVGLIGASAALGIDVEGQPIVHCHALLCGADGAVFGGHLLPHEAMVGDEPPLVFARAFSRVAIAQRPDAETAMSIFHPKVAEPAHG
ncbi:DUF296 domain-containing protein [Aquabacter sp. CN5-332]|uniref:PCC domain-containing protein n=1 Tax=Aquabacter sp. CN5-332 TaxID=3156608 RepID=UPI0032B4DDB3